MPRTYNPIHMRKYGPFNGPGGAGQQEDLNLSEYQQAVVDDGAIALYSMESLAAMGVDASGNNNDADTVTDVTLDGSPRVGDGSGVFNDSTSNIYVGPTSNFSNIASSSFDFAVECWINIPDTTQLRFLCQLAQDATTTGGLSMWIDTSGQVNFRQYWTTNSNIFTSTNTVSTGSWQHIVAMIDSSQNCDIYINGVLSADTQTQTGSGATNTHLTPDLVIGARQWGAASPMDGSMDEFALYRNLLTLQQVVNHYFLGLA